MRPLLYLDNWYGPQPANRFDHAFATSGLDVVTHHPAKGDLPQNLDVAGVFVSASPAGAYDPDDWIAAEHVLLRDLAARNIPMLGLCFGSQILASSLLGPDQVFKRPTKEVGYGPIHLTDAAADDPLLHGLPPTSRTFHWHFDEVRTGHPDLVLLADSPDCANQIWRWAKGPVWGLQPHVECDRNQASAWFERNRQAFTHDGQNVDALITHAEPNTDLEPLIPRFLELVRERAR
jgi:GMP synthase-like glutamine amidotransferase